MELTDMQYGDQYDKLFPDIEDSQDKVADLMDHKENFPQDMQFVDEIEDIYKELWGTECEIPNTEYIEERTLDRIHDALLEACEKEHTNDRAFWENEDYRLKKLEEMEKKFFDTDLACYLKEYIVSALDFLGYAYIDSQNNYKLVNGAQKSLLSILGDDVV